MSKKVKKVLTINFVIVFIISFALSINCYADFSIDNTEVKGGAYIRDSNREYNQGEVVNFDKDSIEWPKASYPVGGAVPIGLPYLAAGKTVEIITPMPYMLACTNQYAKELNPRIFKSPRYSGSTNISWEPVIRNIDEHTLIFRGAVKSVDAVDPNYIVKIAFDFNSSFFYNEQVEGTTFESVDGHQYWQKHVERNDVIVIERVLNFGPPAPPKIEVPNRIIFVDDSVLTKAQIIPNDGSDSIKTWAAENPRYVKTENANIQNAIYLKGNRIGISKVFASTQNQYMDIVTNTMKNARGETDVAVIDAEISDETIQLIPSRSKSFPIHIARPDTSLKAEAFGVEILSTDNTNISHYFTYEITSRSQDMLVLKVTAKSEVHEDDMEVKIVVSYRNDDGAITKKDFNRKINIKFKKDIT